MLDASVSEVLIRRLGGLYVPESASKPTHLTEDHQKFVSDLLRLGYALEPALLGKVLGLPKLDRAALLLSLKRLKGDTEYQTLYEDFTKTVPNSSEVELYIRAIIHYIGSDFGAMIVYGNTPLREALENYEHVVLKDLSKESVSSLANSIAVQGQPYSDQDREDLTNLQGYLDASVEIPIRENLVWLATVNPVWVEQIRERGTVTDVLRLAVAYSGGDTSLSEKVRFKLSRPQRREVVSLLDDVIERQNMALEDFALRAETWKRFFRAVHAGEYDAPAAQVAADSVYNNTVRSFASKVELAILNKDLKGTLNLLKTRPGIFARRLAHVLRTFPQDRQAVLSAFSEVANKVSLRVLVQMYVRFSGPTAEEAPMIRFAGKSRSGRGGMIENKLSGDQSDVLRALELGFAGRHADKTFVIEDQELAGQLAIPMGVRSASSGLRAIGRGSRIAFPEDKDFGRLFMHWRNLENSSGWGSRVDLDLSLALHGDDGRYIEHVSYTNLRTSGAYHSGDITNAPKGAAEFIDMDFKKLRESGVRYAVASVLSFTSTPFDQIPEAWSGLMFRENLDKGEHFEPSTVAVRSALMSPSKNVITMVLDLETREMIWLDLNHNSGRTIESGRGQITALLDEVAHQRALTVMDLLILTGAEVVDEATEGAVEIDPFDSAAVLGLLND